MSNIHLQLRAPSRSFAAAVLTAIAGGVFCASAFAAGDAASSAEARYRQDRAFCLSGQSQQDQPTCLKEAGAALQAARGGVLADAEKGRSQYYEQATSRCEALPAAERQDCVLRIDGVGRVTGSVEGGGVLRELTTTTVITPTEITVIKE